MVMMPIKIMYHYISKLSKTLRNYFLIPTYDYAGGFIINDTIDYTEIYEIEIEDEPFDEFLGNIITYASEKDLFENLRENLIRMDLTKGADDQYYDYSPFSGRGYPIRNPSINSRTPRYNRN